MQAYPHRPSNDVPSRPWFAQRWPWLLMAGPLLVIAAGGYTCWLAFTRPDALVVDDYYVQGKAINQDLRRERAAAVLQLDATLRYDPAAGRIAASLHSAGRPLHDAVRLHLVHSTRPEKDIVLTLVPDAGGQLTASLPMLEQTRWRVLLENPARDWRLAGTWSWPAQATSAMRADAIAAAAVPAAAGKVR